jgi:hypothetical protein
MTFSYRSISESESMLHQFATTTTDSNGNFAVYWLPPSAGSYIVKATYGGDSIYGPEFDGISVLVTDKTQVFTVESNSTVTSLAFNPENSELNLSVTGESGTTGFVDVYVSKSLIGNVSAVVTYVDGSPIAYNVTSTDDSWKPHFNYHHSSHNIMSDLSGAKISSVPEMPNMVLSLIIVALVTIVAVLIILQGEEKGKKTKNRNFQAKIMFLSKYSRFPTVTIIIVSKFALPTPVSFSAPDKRLQCLDRDRNIKMSDVTEHCKVDGHAGFL